MLDKTQQTMLKLMAENYQEEINFLKESYPSLTPEGIRSMHHSTKLESIIALLVNMIDGPLEPNDIDNDELI